MTNILSLLPGYLFHLTLDNWVWLLLLIVVIALPAPYLAFRLIRRNRSLGRDIYREVAQADRFMDIWMAQSPLASNEAPYFRAYVFNGNPAAAHDAKIDDQLARMKLVERFPVHGTYGGSTSCVKPMRGRYLFRNWLVFILLLFLRITFFGDRPSHIASGNGLFSEKQLLRMYWETVSLLIALLLFLLFVILHFL